MAAALLAERAAAAESMIFAVPLCPRDMAHCIGRRIVHPKSAKPVLPLAPPATRRSAAASWPSYAA